MPAPIIIAPQDQYNKDLVQNVHPGDWINPEPKDKYNLVVIGAGTAGLISAIGAASLGARVALIEKHLMGGDCLNVGCVPSKGLIRAARVFAEVRDSSEFGITLPQNAAINFSKVMERMRRLRSHISRNDSVKRYAEMGIDVFLGQGRFLDASTIEVDGKKLKFTKAVIATGARAAEVPIPGLKEAGYLTNETIFNLTELPKRFGIIGSGPIGSEMAQSFARFGSEVFILERSNRLLPREDEESSAQIEKAFIKDGVKILKEAKIINVKTNGNEKIIHLNHNGVEKQIVVDQILLGIGRTPNVEGLDLEKANVKVDLRTDVKVNDHLQTSNPKIFAAGDICSAYKFTHTAEAAASIVIQNALFTFGPFGWKKASSMVIPWCTYTDPEVAHVGLYEYQAKKDGLEIDIFMHPLKEVDRAILDGQENGFIKVITRKNSDQIIGATIVASHAGDMISEITLAMTANVGLGTIAGTIHPYPTQAECIKRAAGLYRRKKLTSTVKNIMTKWLNLTR